MASREGQLERLELCGLARPCRVAGLAVHGVPIAAGEGLRHRVAGTVVHHGEEDLGDVVLLVPVVVVRGREGWLQSLVAVDGRAAQIDVGGVRDGGGRATWIDGMRKRAWATALM